MNSEYVSEALNGLEEAYITEAENTAVKRPARFKWIGAAAACLALVMGTAFFVKTNAGRKPNMPDASLATDKPALTETPIITNTPVITEEPVTTSTPDITADLPKITISNPSGEVGCANQGETVFELSKDNSGGRTAANIYKVKQKEQRTETLLNAARLMGSEDPQAEYDANGRLVVKDEKVNGYTYGDHIWITSKTVDPEPAKEKLYDDSEYIRIAREFLEKIGIDMGNTLSSEPVVTVSGIVDTDDDGCADPDTDDFTYVDVSYHTKQIDGMDRWGSRGFICVNLTNEGVVAQLRGHTADCFDPVEYPLMTVEEVVDLYETDREKLRIFREAPEIGCVATEVSLEYILIDEYRDGLWSGYLGSWLLPVYVFRGERIMPEIGGITIKSSFETVICAISSDYVEFSYMPTD